MIFILIDFIKNNRDKSIAEIALLLSKHPKLDKNYIICQINGLQKAKLKLPTFYQNPQIVYPIGLSMEQCSSEQTAIFKSKLVQGKTMVDLTGGFGIDAYFFSKQFESTNYIEQNPELFELVTRNFNTLNVFIKTNQTSCEEFLIHNSEQFDLAYIDPSRRDETKRVFKLDECTPNVIELLPKLLKTAQKIIIKTSPLLDIKQTLKDLGEVSKVWVVSVNNDCKEVLYLVEKTNLTNPEIIAINLTKTVEEKFNFNYQDEIDDYAIFSQPLKYLYEPNASVLKAGGFKSISSQFQINKISSNTHLYTSLNLIKDFPGRVFKIDQTLEYNEKTFKGLGIKKANITTRNFQDSVDQIKKKLKLTDGGDTYLFAIRDLNEKPLLIIGQKV